MRSDVTTTMTPIAADWSVAETPMPQCSTSTEPKVGSPLKISQGQVVSTEDKNAVLEALYLERRLLTRAARSGTLTPLDQQQLDDLNRYIDFWETEQPAHVSSGAEDVWRKLGELTGEMLALRASLEREKK